MNIWAIIPVKPFNRAKSRLAKALAPEEREALAEKMFRHCLDVITTVKQIGGVMVVSRDGKALSIARDYHVQTVQESGAPELNNALLRASQVVAAQGAGGVLVLPADVPFVQSVDIEQILHLGRYNTTVVVAPDRAEDGTNMLLVNPPGYVPFAFGEGSFQRHLALAREAGATVQIYRSERVALDIDTPADLELYRRWQEEQAQHPITISPSAAGVDGTTSPETKAENSIAAPAPNDDLNALDLLESKGKQPHPEH